MNRAAFHKIGREERLKTVETIKTVLQKEPRMTLHDLDDLEAFVRQVSRLIEDKN